jgi:invasion protein IalB
MRIKSGSVRRFSARLATVSVMIAAALIGSHAPSFAQNGVKPTQAATPATGWTLNCSAPAGQTDLACTLTQTLVVKDSGQRVLTAVLMRKDGKYLLNLGLPHGLNLPKGVDLWIDDAQRVNHPIVTADQKGSYATVTLDDALLAAMKKGRLLNVGVFAFNGNEIILQLTLDGFTAGLTRL